MADATYPETSDTPSLDVDLDDENNYGDIENDIPEDLLDFIDEENLVEYIDDAGRANDENSLLSTRTEVAAYIGEQYLSAEITMKDWKTKYERALKLANMQTRADKKTFPFVGASTVMMPYVQEAMVDFNARTAGEIAFAKEIIHIKIYGKNNDEKEQRANRVSTYLNYQLSETIPMWRANQDKLLYILSGVGTVYKKTYYDPAEDEICSDLVLADEVVFDQNCNSFEEAPEHFQKRVFTRNELICYIRGEQEWDINEEEDLNGDETEYNFIEAHCWYDLDGDGLEEPYTFMYWEDKERIVSMTADYDESDIRMYEGEVIKISRRETFTQYKFLPDSQGGPMGVGWGILMGPMFKAINTNVRQLLDAGTLAITASNSGLIVKSVGKGRGVRNGGGPIKVKMGQLSPIDAGGLTGSLKDNVVQFPFAGPNPVLFQLMEYLVESSRQLTAAAKQVDVNANQAASLYLAQLQQALKIPNSIALRVYGFARDEFRIISRLNHKFYDDKKYQRVLDMLHAVEEDTPVQPPQGMPPQGMPPQGAPQGPLVPQMPQVAPVAAETTSFSMEEDFNPGDCDIRIVADPSQGSQMERTARAEAVLNLAVTTPGVIDIREATVDVLKAMRTPDIDRLAPKPDPSYQSPKEKLILAKMQSDEESAERDRALREQDQQLKSQQLQIQAAEMQYKAEKERLNLGLETELKEAEIVDKYATALKKIAEASNLSLQESLATMEQLKGQIDTEEGAQQPVS